MSSAARSLFVFGLYVMCAGVSFLVAPSAIVGLLALPPATDGWVRIVGLLAVVIGLYDVVASRAGSLPYIRASVPIRFFFAVGVTVLVATGQMPATVLPLGVIDAAGAIWTALALRKTVPEPQRAS